MDSSGNPVHLRKVQGRGSDVFAIIESSSYTSNGTRGGDIFCGGVHLERGAGREIGYDIPILWYWIDKDAALAEEEYQRYAPEREAEARRKASQKEEPYSFW